MFLTYFQLIIFFNLFSNISTIYKKVITILLLKSNTKLIENCFLPLQALL